MKASSEFNEVEEHEMQKFVAVRQVKSLILLHHGIDDYKRKREAVVKKKMRSALSFCVFFGLVLCTSAAITSGKTAKSGKSAKKPVKKPSKGLFAECISPTSDYMNKKLRKYLQTKMQQKEVSTNITLVLPKSYPLFLCPLAEVAKPGQKYGEFFPGGKVFRYKFKKTYRYKSHYYNEFERKYGPVIIEYPTLLVTAIGVRILPYGCSWDYKEVNCVFVTEKFFRFLRLLAKLGNVQPLNFAQVMPFLQRLHQAGFSLDF
ncbi:unnamed protein product [Cylicocyclus nassatus]|uniref:Uncharacterized protein n=1 Tax=Cylicocyclus nassatus TaxID=53992 RepID=A0AA36DMK8_CYLNA|nr:unnamed protein product [Cylicocyclus nassatus]